MRNGKVIESDLTTENEIYRLLESRKENYGDVLLKVIFIKDDTTNDLRNHLTIFEVLHKDDELPSEFYYDYGDYILARKIININSLKIIIQKLIHEGLLQIKGLPNIFIEGYIDKDNEWPSKPSNEKPLGLLWGFNEFVLRADEKFKSRRNSRPILSKDLPFFPDSDGATTFLTGIDTNRWNRYSGAVSIILPNYKAKIKSVKIGSKDTSIEINVKDIDLTQILGKVFLEKMNGKSLQKNFHFKDKVSIVNVGFTPDRGSIVILSKADGELIDFRRFYTGWESQKDVIFEDPGEEISYLISRGENDRLEYKEKMDRDKIMKTIVAFTNTYGGIILLGVSNEGEIKGITENKVEETVHNWIRSYCDPPISVNVQEEIIAENTIILIKVKEGENKPYIHRDRGIIVRSGSTNRTAFRHEVDAMYEKKQNTYLDSRSIY